MQGRYKAGKRGVRQVKCRYKGCKAGIRGTRCKVGMRQVEGM